MRGTTKNAYQSNNSILVVILVLSLLAIVGIHYLLTLPNAEFDPFAILRPLMGEVVSLWDKVASILSVVIVFLFLFFFIRKEHSSNTHGNAQFASHRELKKAGMFKRHGIVLGYFIKGLIKTPLIFNDNESVLVTMPTGIGKTSGVVVPTVLAYQGSMFITDLKGEISSMTAGYRSLFSEVHIFRFNGKPTSRINLLDFIRWETRFQTRDITRLAASFFPPVKGDYFADAPRDLFVALIESAYHLDDMPTTMKTVWYLINPEVYYKDSDGNFTKPTKEVSDNAMAEYFIQICGFCPSLSDESKRILQRFSVMPYRQLQGVLDGLNKELTPFSDALIDEATCETTIPIKDVRRKLVTIYFELSANEYKIYAPIIKIYYEFIQDVLMDELPEENEKYPCLFLYDEFANLGELKEFARFISLCRQYKLQVMAIVQSFSQLSEVYGKKKNTLVSAFKKQLFSVVNDEETGIYISKRIGKKTSSVASYSGDRYSDGGRSRISYSEVGEELVKGYETYLMEKKKGLLFLESQKPTKFNIIESWKDTVFKARIKTSKERGIDMPKNNKISYSAISNYPCVVTDEQSQVSMPESLDLSEYADLFADE